jgi:uroporphyrin-III C-methyltransferase
VGRARLGRTVARLKGGDPFVFGRGGEEALALVAAGVPFEVIPGVSSAVAVPAYAGIPVTHRGAAPLFTVVTGHERPAAVGDGGEDEAVDWGALARLGGTLVILMGVGTLPRITRRLLEGGLGAETPAAVIQQGTTGAQRVVAGTLADIAGRAAAAGLTSPAVTVVGAVAALRDSLAWFDPAALAGRSEGASLSPTLTARGR